jgi:hypothetical protein
LTEEDAESAERIRGPHPTALYPESGERTLEGAEGAGVLGGGLGPGRAIGVPSGLGPSERVGQGELLGGQPGWRGQAEGQEQEAAVIHISNYIVI